MAAAPRHLIVVVGLVTLAVTSCSGDSPSCGDLSARAKETLGFDAVAAVEAPDFANGAAAWYVATSTGGLWVTSVPPDTGDGGLTVPLNDQARTESDVGVDASPDAPGLGGADADSAAARKALNCA